MTVQWHEHWLGSFENGQQMGRDIRICSTPPSNHPESTWARPTWRWMSTLPVYHPCHHSSYRIHKFVYVRWKKSGTTHIDLQHAA